MNYYDDRRFRNFIWFNPITQTFLIQKLSETYGDVYFEHVDKKGKSTHRMIHEKRSFLNSQFWFPIGYL